MLTTVAWWQIPCYYSPLQCKVLTWKIRLFLTPCQGFSRVFLGKVRKRLKDMKNGYCLYSVPIIYSWSGRKDSNLRPPAPKAGALTRLRYAPTSYTYYMVDLGGFEPPASSVRRKRAPPALQPHMANGDYCNDGERYCQGALYQKKPPLAHYTLIP